MLTMITLNGKINKVFTNPGGKMVSRAFLLLLISSIFVSVHSSECIECVEVDKGKIPEKFLNEKLKDLPSGIAIWDVQESIKALTEKAPNILWVETRPSIFFNMGTIKNSALLVCDLKGKPLPDSDKENGMTKEKLEAEMKKINSDISKVKAVFFCQGPKCHRSYNAAIRAVKEYGLSANQIIWLRAGYPNIEKKILSTPKLNAKKALYLQGSNIN